MAKPGIQHMFQPLYQALVHKLVKKGHFFRGVFQHITDNILKEPLCKGHIIF